MTPNPVKGTTAIPKDTFNDPKHPSNNPKYQPDSMSNNSTEPSKPQVPGQIDGDHTAKAFEAGANSATNVTDLTDGIHEGVMQNNAAGAKATGQGTSIFSKDGAIGSQFKGDGNLGGIGNAIGGPFSSQGAIGKHFEADGAVGGKAQEVAKKNEDH